MVLEDSWESLGQQGDPTSPSSRKSVLNIHWKDWCWSWNSYTLATWCEELTHLKRPWCWEGLGAGGEGNDRGWDGWMASGIDGRWVWVNSRSWWWTGRPGVLRFMGSHRVGHDWATELNWLNWTELVGKVISLLYNMLSRLVRTFLPRSKHLLISWLQSPSAVILVPKIIKSVTVSIVSLLFAMKWGGQMPWSSFF